MEILRRKKWYFGRREFIFVLPIRNKSPFSGKIITFFKIEKMTLNLLAIWPKHKIEMQIIYDGRKVQVWEFVSQGLDIGKSSTGKHCDGVAVVKNVKTIMCKEGGTLPLIMAVTSVYVIVCWFLCWILFLPCQLSSGTWKSLPASELSQIANEKISCRTQKCNFWKRSSTDFEKLHFWNRHIISYRMVFVVSFEHFMTFRRTEQGGVTVYVTTVVSSEVGHVTIFQRSGTCVCGEGTSRIFGPKATSAVMVNGKMTRSYLYGFLQLSVSCYFKDTIWFRNSNQFCIRVSRILWENMNH